MAGYVCHEHFEATIKDRSNPPSKTWEQREEEEANCDNCQSAKAAARDRIQREHTIDPSRPYGQHIGLICTVCQATFSTKNIDYIGARSIFPTYADCPHSINDLEVKPVHESTNRA